jgi:hypothetical protein
MRAPFISGEQALRERMLVPGQVANTEAGGGLPPYSITFLSRLRLLVGVPFEYLVPDPRLLPNESIRFFYLDRSWTDRLIDGALAVGKIGTREQAHHQNAAPAISFGLDAAEPDVRPTERGMNPPPSAPPATAPPITGFLLRSAVVAGWPHMEARAYDAANTQLILLRLARLAPAVMLALFAGIPARVELEEPHHGVQFGTTAELGQRVVDRRRADGSLSPASDTPGSTGTPTDVPSFPVALRDSTHRVVQIAALRRLLSAEADQRDPQMPVQSGSAGYAVQLLQPPWRQVFSDAATATGAPASLASTAHPSIPASTPAR